MKTKRTSLGQEWYDEDRGINPVPEDEPKTTKPLSDQQLRALKCLRDGRSVSGHCTSQSDYGGLHGTMFSLLRLRFITDKHELTEMGRRAIEREEHRRSLKRKR